MESRPRRRRTKTEILQMGRDKGLRMMAKRVKDTLAMEPSEIVDLLNAIQPHLPRMRSDIDRFLKTGRPYPELPYDPELPSAIALCAVNEIAATMTWATSRGKRDTANIRAFRLLVMLDRIELCNPKHG